MITYPKNASLLTTSFLHRPNARICLAVLLAFATVNAAILPRSGIAIEYSSLVDLRGTVLSCAFLSALAIAIVRRLDHDRSRIARRLSNAAETLFDLSLGAAVLSLFGASATLASYLVITLGMPLQDQTFAAMDKALGVNWTAVLAWANSHPLLTRVLVYAYASNIAQLICLFLFFTLARRESERWEFLAVVMLSALLTLAGSAVVPALAAFQHYQPDPALHQTMDAIIPNLGRTAWRDVLALHDGTFKIFDLRRADGIICFPSYHTLMGLAFTYAVRNVGYLFWPVAILNCIMIVATLPIGGHYLVDILASFGFFAATVAIVDHVNGAVPFWQRWRARNTTADAMPEPVA